MSKESDNVKALFTTRVIQLLALDETDEHTTALIERLYNEHYSVYDAVEQVKRIFKYEREGRTLKIKEGLQY